MQRFSDRSRRVVVLAQEESRLLNHGYIGTEHILLGLIAVGDGQAAQTLQGMGVTLESARQKVAAVVGVGRRPPRGSQAFTPGAKGVLELANRESLQFGHATIDTGHLLLATIRDL